jgi:Toxin SymE, type I toxin-antitoxin system
MPTRTKKSRKERRITTSSIHRAYEDERFGSRTRNFPFLRFGGAWLEHAGFAIGQKVRVHIGKQRIVIKPDR